jgi:hypothetical protein
MADAQEIITAAFNKIQVTTVTTAQTADALINLNNMVSLLGADNLMYGPVTESFSLTVGDAEYTIGTSADFDTVRPLRVHSCYLRDGNNYDWPVNCNLASKDYNRLSSKSFTARPTSLYFLPEYTSAKIIFDAAPDYAYTAVFEFIKNFTEFAATTTTVSLPPEYKEALVYNLAVSLAEDWGRTIPQSLIVKAEQYKDIIKHLIASQRKVSKARFDFAGVDRSSYECNIVTDDVIDGGAF